MSLTIALVAGEDSGDQLGSALIARLREQLPGGRFVGIGGNRMKAAGMECWWHCEELAVFGLFEVVKHFRRIWGIRRDVHRRLLAVKPDMFIGIDAPDFNLGLERRLKAAGISTAHYVSPTVWAWRAWRIDTIRQAADIVLCLFPFEPAFLESHGIAAAYVGHPMADQIDQVADTAEARQALGLDTSGPVFALLAGSRLGEVSRLAPPMLDAADLLKTRFPQARFITALAGSRVAECFKAALQSHEGLEVVPFEGRAREVIAAADVVLCASGTATLETMLINRPMVVAYRLARSTYWLARATRLVKSRHVALPNILAGEPLVPELIQGEATAEGMAAEAAAWLEDSRRRGELREAFARLHRELRCNASQRVAEEILRRVRQP